MHALTLSAHKIGGPKGAGALVLDKRVELEALIAGGSLNLVYDRAKECYVVQPVWRGM